MEDRRRFSVGSVLEQLGTTLLGAAHVPTAASTRAVSEVVILDPIELRRLSADALVLGIGSGPAPDDLVQLVGQLGERSASVLIVRAPLTAEPRVVQACEEARLALLTLARGASWSHLVAMLRLILAENEVTRSEGETIGGVPAGDLFSLANAVSALVDAPITIEDRDSRVLAFSSQQGEADEARTATILGRKVPERYSRVLRDRGTFRELYRATEPVFLDVAVLGPDQVGRAAIPIRAGQEILGSIWAAVIEPLSETRARALLEAAHLVALHILRQRAGNDVERRLRAQLVSTALEGGGNAREAMDRLRLADQAVVVIALGLRIGPGPADEDSDPGALERMEAALAMHLNAVHTRSATAILSDVIYGIVPVPGASDDGIGRAKALASEFLQRTETRFDACLAVGGWTDVAAGLPHARRDADRVLRILVQQPPNGPRSAALDDVYIDALMLDLHDLVTSYDDPPVGPIALLLDYDRQHRSHLIETLRTWLDHFGDVGSAAAAVYVHPNTFRYRLRRVGEIGAVDLTDPEERFSLMVQLRLLTGGSTMGHRRDSQGPQLADETPE